MREWDEERAWRKLMAAAGGRSTHTFQMGSRGTVEIDLSRGCTVIAGRNGAGKSQVLAAARDELGDDSVLIQLHQVCEHAISALRSREDIADMEQETGALPLDEDLVGHLRRVVGREYEEVQWFSLELEPTDDYQESFQWPGDQALVPHFRVLYQGVEYTSLEMGLGEFSVHVLFWMLQQFRDSENLTILLDEPDAYLPPSGSFRLLARLMDFCLRHRWGMVVATHSEEMIRAACENDGLMVVRRGQDASIESLTSWLDGPSIAGELLPKPALGLVLFCEDEAAAALVRSLLRAGGERYSRISDVIWNNGHGYLTALGEHLPRHRAMRLKFVYVYDGDQRESRGDPDKVGGWPSIYLPSSVDPAELFKTLRTDPERLASGLSRSRLDVDSWLDSLEGSEPHDWLDGVCARHGERTRVHDTLADLWVSDHEAETLTFIADLDAGLEP